MNDLLRDTLAERADGAEPPALDLDAIVAAGDRHITRRRFGSVVGGAVVTLGTIAGGVAVARSVDRRPAPTPAEVRGFVERRATYALGSEIHYGQDVMSVAPHKINAFVQTDAGFVFLNHENAIHIADNSGVRALGKSAWRLTADNRGSMVAWVEGFNDHYESVVYDVASARELVRTGLGNKIPANASLAVEPRIVAIDGNHAYFGTLGGLYTWDIATNQGALMAEVPPNAVRTVAAGQLVYQQPLVQAGTGVTLKVGPTLTTGRRATYIGHQAYLSPGAKYLVTQPDDAKSGIEPGMAGIRPAWEHLQLFGVPADNAGSLQGPYWDFQFGQWLDDTTFTAAGVRPERPAAVDLLTCNARTGACTVVLRAFSELTFSRTPPRSAPFAMPTGNPILDLY